LGAATSRILVVDDYEPWRLAVCSALQTHPELEIVGTASDGLEAVQKAKETEPDLIVLDLGLPKLNGIEAARRIREFFPKVKILFLTEHCSWEIAQEALRTANAYILKSNVVKELIPAIEAVLKGKQFLSGGLPRQQSDLKIN
jgi:DNA-binding NarL/FixJ family response regulator